MNILPKKRWHVRTKENIERVRRDEEQAANEEKERLRKIALAESEARTDLLRVKARKRQRDGDVVHEEAVVAGASTSSGHVNFFEELEAGESGTTNGNADREKEKKKEQEEYEKKVGILVHLGQDTNELTGNKAWWEKVDRNSKEESEKQISKDKIKDLLDPLNSVRKYLGTEGVQKIIKKSSKSRRSPSPSKKKKHKKEKKSKKKSKKSKKKSSQKKSLSSAESDDDEDLERIKKQHKLEKLRQERLKREMKEREKANHVLYGTPIQNPDEKSKKDEKKSQDERKYNSQFNPQFAKQNKLDAKEKYWLS